MQKKTRRELYQAANKLLADSGFEDIECANDNLKTYHSAKFQKVTPDLYNARRKYYEVAYHIALNYKFGTKVEAEIWNLHAEGWSLRMIGRKVNLSKDKVHKVVKSIRELLYAEIYNSRNETER